MKHFFYRSLLRLILISILTVGISFLSFSQNQISSALYGTFSFTAPSNIIYYCSSDGEDKLTAITPAGGNFVGASLYNINNGSSPTTAYINPSTLPIGDYNFTFNGKAYIARIGAPPVVTLAALPDQCQNGAAISLIPYGNPAGGIFSGTGVSGTSFSPSTSGAGSFVISYTYPAAGCKSSASQTIIVNAVPTVTLQNFSPVCQGTPSFILTQGAPAGGTYSGTGVAGGVFYPVTAGVGTHTITYTVVSGTCSASASKTITVNALPSVTFSGLIVVPTSPWYCDNDIVAHNLTGNYAGGSFIGPGIINIGGGSATFTPKTAGVGFHDIAYTYTDVNGCTNSKTLQTRVGTMIYINGLDLKYCNDAAIDNFSYTPYDVFPKSTVYGSGVTDLFNGNATFNPATAAIGNNVVTYEYTDASSCVNKKIQNVEIDAVPVANFSGLNATLKYCSGAGDVLLTGNYAPGGTFTGPPGSIVDNGNGTATFKPSVLGIGTHTITYSYTNASGCSDTESKSVEILSLPSSFNITGGGTFCETGVGLVVGIANSTTGINYQLFRDAIAVAPPNVQPGSTGNPIAFGLQPVAGTYTAIATNTVTGCSQQMSGNATIIVIPKASITTQPINATVCQDGSTSFTIDASGQGLSYQWVKNGMNVGINSNVLVLNGITLAENGQIIYCNVTSTCGGPLKSNEVTLTVNPKTVIATNPNDAIICSGGGVTFSIVATGVNKIYKWKKGAIDVSDLAGKISGSNTSSLTIFNLNATDAGLYSCVVTGDCGSSVQSTQAQLSVNDPIAITTQPISKTACTGDNTSFSVVATGTTLSYQWQKNNVNIFGATNSSLTINGVVAGDAGTYKCIVSSPCGASLSTNNVTLTVPANTALSLNPVSGTVCEGSAINLSVSATGDLLQYEWYQNGTLLSNNAIVSNSSTPNISFTGITNFYNDTYWVKAIGTCGTLTSLFATITVKKSISFTSQPANQTVCSGSDASFTVVVSGDILGYQWQRDVGLGYVNIGGATNPTYNKTGALAADAGNYRCVITTSNCGGPYNSASAALIVNPTTAITVQPISKNTCVGSTVNFSVVATGVGLSYQWYKNTPTLPSLIAGATNSTLTLTSVLATDAADYICVVSGTCGIVTSLPGKLSVDIAAIIGTQPQSKTICSGTATDLTVVVPTGTNLTYQWVKDGVNIGTNSPVYNIASFAAGNAGTYVCSITNNCGTVTSNPAILTLGSAVSITSNPVALSICIGSIANFTVSATGSNLIYQWLKDDISMSNGGTISGVNSSTLTINGVVAGDAGNYKCVVTNSCNTQTSTPASLTVSQVAIITQQPQNATGCLTKPLNIVTVASGTNLTYQWYKNGAPAGLNNPVYAIMSYAAGDAGTYRCEITNGCGTVVSNSVVIATGVTTSITTQPVSANRCIGSDVNFNITAVGSNLTYQWKKDGVAISDNARISATNSNSLSITGVILTDIGTYTCDAIGSCTTITSSGAVLSVKNPVVITDQPDNLTVCNGTSAIFNVIATGDNLTYSWQKNGVAIAPAETSSSLVLTGVNNGDEGVYNCIVSNSCSFEISTSADLIVDDNLLITTQPLSVTQCEGTNVSFTVNATAPPTTTYQWYKDGGIVSNNARTTGATSSILNINSIVPTDFGSYSCKINSSCGSVETDIAVLTVNKNVTITVSPTSFSVLNGSTATFTVVAAGTITGYQWRKDGVDLPNGGNISGALTANLSIANATAADQASYTCYVTGTCSSTPSNSAYLTVITSSVITTQPVASATICEAGTLNLFITTSGATHTYQWKKNNINVSGANISGATSPTLTVSNLLTTDQGAYTCLVDGIESSSPSVVLINPLTIITTQPIDAVKCVNDFVTFAVVANGSMLSYQWQKNNVNIGAAIGSNYTINPLVDGEDGIYTCVVTGACGSKTSNPATLVVNKNTIITTQPTGSTICEGTSKTFSIVADGDNLTYQWEKNGAPLANGGNISGATTSNLQISNALTTNAGSYSCTVSGACGSLVSNVVSLVVNPLTIITTQPIGRTKCAGDNIVFSVGATGTGLTYRWQKNGVDVVNDGNITGAATASLSIATISQIAHQGTYTCIVSGSCGILVNSLPAVLTVSDVTSITTQPSASITICQNASTTINITATGGNLTYQWYKNGGVISDGGNISGTLTNSLIISNALVTDAGFYSCIVTGNCGSETSNIAVLQINPTTVITTHPIGQTLCGGDNVQFTVAATGSNLTYQWRKDNVDIPLATSNTLSINSITNSEAGGYTCAVTGTCGVTVISNTANLIVNPKIAISTQPLDVSVCDENVAIFSLAATGTNLTYQWKKNNLDISDNARITGSNTNQLRIALATNADEGIFKCEVASSCGILESFSAVLNVNDSTVITAHPTSQTLLQGSTATFNVAASGAGLTYQWQKNNADIAGATSSSYSILGVLPIDAGSYKCIVTGTCGIVASNIAVLTVNQPVSITTQPVAKTRCVGLAASFNVVATGTIVSYQWKFNGANIIDGGIISGAQTSNLVIASVNSTHDGSYSCVVTGSNNVANSSSVQLIVNQLVTIVQQPLTQTKCNGDILILEVTPNDPTYTYSWELNGTTLADAGRISGAITSKLVITSVTSSDAGTYRCTVLNSCGSQTSNPAIVTIKPIVSITAEPSNLNQCEGQTAYFSVVSNISTVNYQWYKDGGIIHDGGNISGTLTANLIITNLATTDSGNYSCRVSDNCSYDNSIVAQLTVKNKTVIQKQPLSMTVCEGSVAFFELEATPVGLTYKWQKDGLDLSDIPGKIEGAATSVLVIKNAAISDVAVYRCVITGGCNDEISNPSSLTVNPFSAAAGTISGLQTICQGSLNVLYVVPAIANASTYIWDVPYGSTIVGGAGTRTIQVNYSNSSVSGVVTVYGQNGCGNGTPSAPLAITVNPLPTANANVDQIVCGTSTVLSANPVAGTWTILSGDALISNPNSFSSAVTSLKKGVNEFIWSVTQSGCMARDTVKITNAMIAVNAGIDQTICSSSTNLQAITPTSGATWTVVSGSGVIANTSSSNSSVSVLAQDVNRFAWQVNNLGCVVRDTVTINNHRPNQPNAGIDQTIDIDQTTLDGSIPETGTTGFWSLITGGGIFTNLNDPKTTITNLISGTNVIVWSVVRNSCTLSDTMVIENIMIEDPDAGLNQTLCANHTTLDAKFPNIGTGEWSVISGTAFFVNKNSNTTKVTNLGHGYNWLKWTVRTSGLGMEYDTVLIINNEPTPANAGPDLTLCVDSVYLMANVPIYGSGTWTLNSGAGQIVNILNPSSLIRKLGQGKNDLKWTINNSGCVSEDFVSITNNIPTTAYAGPDQTICFDSTLLYPNTPSIGIGSWSLISGSATFVGNEVTHLGPSPNPNVLRYTITQGSCKSIDDVLIKNNKPTTPNAGYDQNVCVNNTILNANPITQGTGVWTIISGSGTFSNYNINNPSVTGIADGINIYRWTISKNGCAEQDEVIVSNDYVVATAGEDVTLCVDNTQLKASNPLPGIGTWSVVGNSGATFDSQNSPNSMVRNLSKGTNTFRWTVTHGGCVAFDEVQVTNNQPTQALAGENQAVCSKTAILNANQATFGTGVWSAISGSGTFTNQNSYQTAVNNLAGGPNVLRWTITQGSCISYDEVTITSNLPVNVFAGNDQVACSNAVVLSANPPSIGSGEWSIISGAGSFDNRTLFNTTVRNLGQGDNVFKWTVSSSDCHLSDTVVIRSSIPSSSIAGANQIICSETATLGGNTPVNGTGTWTIVSGSVEFTNKNLPNTNVLNIARGVNILAWVIDKDGCQSSSELTITNNLPSAPFAGYDSNICSDSTRLFADPPTIGTGKWSLVSGDAAILNSSQNQTRVTNIKFGANTFRWTITNLNCLIHDDVIVTSNYAYANAGSDRNVNTATIQLIGNVPASGTGSWALSAGQANIQNPDQFDTWVNALGSGANIFTWSVNNNGCIASDEITINYVVMPIADFNPTTIEGCSPFAVNFVNTSIGGTPYSWDFGDGATSNETNIVHTFILPGTYKVVLTATAPLGQSMKKEGTIIVHGHPKAEFDISPKEIYIPGQRISSFNYSQFAKTSIWDFGDGKTITELAPKYEYADTGRFNITLKVLNTYDCADSVTRIGIVHVKKRSELFFPEAFTPNPNGSSGGVYDTQDRSNDVFYPILVDGEITDYELKVYNRSGVLLFKTNDVKIGWDGYYKNSPLPQDVYIYMVTGRYNSSESFQRVHNVLLIRKDK